MEKQSYESPISLLFTEGDCRQYLGKWPDYLEMGFTEEHIPDLIELVKDDELRWNDSDESEAWVSIHAWRVLGQLRAVEAVDALLEVVHEIDDRDFDWMGGDFPVVFMMIGPKALPSLTSYLMTKDKLYAQACVIHGIEKIGNQYPEYKEECIDILTKKLAKFQNNDEILNAFLVCYLLDLKAAESIDVIREAYQQDKVDYAISGSLEEVEVDLGLREKRSVPKTKTHRITDEVLDVLDLLDDQPKSKKVGRNDPCPCGSGKKYKKCCL